MRGTAVRLAAQQGPHSAAPRRPHRGGVPPPGGAGLDRRPHPVDQRGRRPGDRAARHAGPRVHRRGRGPPHPLHHHVPRPAAAPHGPLHAAVRRRLRPRYAHRRAAHDRAAPVRSGDRRDGGPVPRGGGSFRQPRPPDRADRTRGHGHRERAAGRRPARRRHRHPQRLVQLHGPGPVLLPGGPGRQGRGHRHHHAHRARHADDRRRRGLLPLRGPGRGDEPARRGRRHGVRADGAPGADRVPGDRARGPGGDGPRPRPHPEYVADNGRTRLVDLTVRPSSWRRRSTRSTRCRSPA